jgi:polysaccharide biosynthesis protein PslH
MKVLFLLPRFPYPLYKGDQLRAYHQIRQLAQHYEVYVFAVSDKGVSAEEQAKMGFVKEIRTHFLSKMKIALRIALHFFQKTPFQVAYFYEAKAQQKLDEFIAEIQPDIIFCQLARMAKYVEKYPKKQKLLDYQDTFSVGLGRRIKEHRGLYRWIVKMEFERMQAYEKNIFADFALKTIISDADRQLLPHPQKAEIKLLPNGVDATHFSAQIAEKKLDLLFTGNMNYPPNISCVQYVAQAIIPLVLPQFPGISFVIAGANPHPKVKELASKNVHVTGFVPDLRTYYNETKIFIAPMQIGIGMQNKLLEAMAMGLPCITSSLANAAIKGTNAEHLFVCDSPESIADTIAILLKDKELRERIGKNARDLILAKYAWEAQNSLLMTWMQEMQLGLF